MPRKPLTILERLNERLDPSQLTPQELLAIDELLGRMHARTQEVLGAYRAVGIVPRATDESGYTESGEQPDTEADAVFA